MIEIRLHGRGGQGVKTAGELIAETALDEGKFIQAFPEFGPERSGAPVEAFVKISDQKILSYGSIKHAEVVLIIDDSLLDERIAENIANTCIIIINSSKNKNEVLKRLGFKRKVYLLDATKIALKETGKNLPNLVLIGSLIKVSNIIKLNNFEKKVREVFGEKIGRDLTEANIKAIKRGYNEIKV